MSPAALVRKLAAREIELHLAGDDIEVIGIDRLTEAELASLRQHKAQLITYLNQPPAGNDPPAGAHAPLPPAVVEALLERYGDHLTVEVDDQCYEVSTRDVLRYAAPGDEQDLARLSVMIAFCRCLIEAGTIEAFARLAQSPPALFTWPGRLIRCADCRHHRRTDHPHLVDCARGVAPTNPTRLFWDTDRRCCDRYEPAPCVEPTP